jgi:hypothetical protein
MPTSSCFFTYGAMGAFDGGILQLIELTAWGYLALAFYVVFEGCLDGLLGRIAGGSQNLRKRTGLFGFILRRAPPSSPGSSPARSGAPRRLP